MYKVVRTSTMTRTNYMPINTNSNNGSNPHKPKTMHEVIIVGAGTTGAAAAYHLAQHGVRNILVLDMGTPGKGLSTTGAVPQDNNAPSTTTAVNEETQYMPQKSGSAVFDGGHAGPATIKMIVTLPPYLELEEFAKHHGWDGVASYMNMAKRGLEMEVDIANKVLPNPSQQIKRLGSLMVCESQDVHRLYNEYQHLCRLNIVNCEWWNEDKVNAAHGQAANFKAGIWFPDEARVNSTAYARALLDAVATKGTVTVEENCAPMISVKTISSSNDSNTGASHAEIRLANGRILHAKYAIVATGGMHIDENLSGLLTPRYSYLVGLPHPPSSSHGHNAAAGRGQGMTAPDSSNFYTFGFSHDWCVESNFVRISGEDHYSGLKCPRAKERNTNLATWGYGKYPYLDSKAPYPEAYGIYSETADFLPLVGMTRNSSAVCYMVGCNAWGQASLSAIAGMAPALLGYREFRPEELDAAKLCSIQRFVGRDVIESARAATDDKSPVRSRL